MTSEVVHSQSALSRSSTRRLFFDRRYGWVYDIWKDPSEDALAGGRGMFCVLPLAKAVLKETSKSHVLTKWLANKIDVMVKHAVEVSGSPDPQITVRGQLQRLASSMKNLVLGVINFLPVPRKP